MIKPTKDKVFVRLHEIKDMTDSGLHLVRQGGQQIRGDVVAVGPGRITKQGYRVPPEVKIGDDVLIDYKASIPVMVNGEKLRALYERDILGIYAD